MTSEQIYLRELIRIESVKFGEWIRRNRWKSNAPLHTDWRRMECDADGWHSESSDTFALYDKYYEETHAKTEQE